MSKELITSPELAKASINMSLAKASFSIQRLQTAVDSIVPNEDGLQKMADAINMGKSMKKEAEIAFKAGKAVPLEACRSWDTAKRDFDGLIDTALASVTKTYQDLCTKIAKRTKEQEEEKAENDRLKSLVDVFILDAGSKIQGITNIDQLTALQKELGLAKTRKSTYKWQLDNLIARINLLQPLLNEKKQTLQLSQKEIIGAENALNAGQDAEYLESQEKQGVLAQKIEEIGLNAQSSAYNTVTGSETETAVAELPEVRGKKYLKYKISNTSKALAAGMLDVSINPAKAKENIEAIKQKMKDNKLDEYTENGLCYYIETKFA